jgi:RND family efflux transporter MFP subunit
MPVDNIRQMLRRSSFLFIAGLLIVAGSLTMAAALIWKQRSSFAYEQKIRKDALRHGRKVRVVRGKKSRQLRPVELVGEARPYATVTLYAKISGYIQEIKVDKGDRVDSGQLIAIIDSPELHRQHEGAVADASNKRLDARRYQELLKSGSVSQQSADNVETTAKVAEEAAAALGVQKDYEIVRAPFSGTISARYVDPGALVQSATSAQTTALPIVTLSQLDLLRVYVYPDQKIASMVKIGDRVEIADPNWPDKKFAATVTRTSKELDTKTRTLLVEIELKNEREEILAGSFVQVTLFVQTPETVEIPAQGLIMQENKAFVPIVSDEDKVVFRPVSIYDTDGRKVWLLSGLSPGDRVILNPSESFREGETVQPIMMEGEQIATQGVVGATRARP